MWNLPGPGVKPISPALADGYLTTGPPEESPFEDQSSGDECLQLLLVWKTLYLFSTSEVYLCWVKYSWLVLFFSFSMTPYSLSAWKISSHSLMGIPFCIINFFSFAASRSLSSSLIFHSFTMMCINLILFTLLWFTGLLIYSCIINIRKFSVITFSNISLPQSFFHLFLKIQ